MTINVGTVDRLIRAVAGLVLVGLPFALGWGTVGMAISVIVGLVLLGTAAMRICPAYMLFGIRTCRS